MLSGWGVFMEFNQFQRRRLHASFVVNEIGNADLGWDTWESRSFDAWMKAGRSAEFMVTAGGRPLMIANIRCQVETRIEFEPFSRRFNTSTGPGHVQPRRRKHLNLRQILTAQVR